MPYAGGTSFLPKNSVLMRLPYGRVNALCGRDFISTSWLLSNRSRARRSCVNALCGRDFISTALPWKPVFMRVSGLFFPRIFQNILTIPQIMEQKWAEGKLYFWDTILKSFYWFYYNRFSKINNNRFWSLDSLPSIKFVICSLKFFAHCLLLTLFMTFIVHVLTLRGAGSRPAPHT